MTYWRQCHEINPANLTWLLAIPNHLCKVLKCWIQTSIVIEFSLHANLPPSLPLPPQQCMEYWCRFSSFSNSSTASGSSHPVETVRPSGLLFFPRMLCTVLFFHIHYSHLIYFLCFCVIPFFLLPCTSAWENSYPLSSTFSIAILNVNYFLLCESN